MDFPQLNQTVAEFQKSRVLIQRHERFSHTSADRRCVETLTGSTVDAHVRLFLPGMKPIHSFGFSRSDINRANQPNQALTSGMKKERRKGSAEAGEPLVELLANAIPSLLGTNSVAQGNIKAHNFSSCFCCRWSLVHLSAPYPQIEGPFSWV